MKFYHGSKTKIEKFILNNEFMTNSSIMEQGPGIYLTSSINDAKGYGNFVYEVDWKPRKRLPTKRTSYPMEHYRNFLSAFIKKSPDWEDSAMNWDEDPKRGLQLAIDSILESYETPKERFEQIWFDFFRNDPALYCQNMARVGYDGFIIQKKDDVTHAVVFNPNTIKILKVHLQEGKKIDTGFSEIPVVIKYLNDKYSCVSIKDVENETKKHFKKVKKKIPKDDDFNNELFGSITSAGMSIGGESTLKRGKMKVEEAVQILENISKKKVILEEVEEYSDAERFYQKYQYKYPLGSYALATEKSIVRAGALVVLVQFKDRSVIALGATKKQIAAFKTQASIRKNNIIAIN